MNALHKNQKDSLKRILDKLRRHNDEMKMTEAIGQKVKNQLLKNLKKHSQNSLKKYLDMLRENNRDFKRQNEERDKAAGILGRNLFTGGKDSLKKALDSLRRNNMRGQLQEMQQNFAMQKLMEKLKNGLNKKKGHCVAELIMNKKEKVCKNMRIKELYEILL